MPTISRFLGFVISLYFYDDRRHKGRHIHVSHGTDMAVFSIPDGRKISGKLSGNKERVVTGWIALREQELLVAWDLAAIGEHFKIIKGIK